MLYNLEVRFSNNDINPETKETTDIVTYNSKYRYIDIFFKWQNVP